MISVLSGSEIVDLQAAAKKQKTWRPDVGGRVTRLELDRAIAESL